MTAATILDRATLVRLTPEQYVDKVAAAHLSRRERLVLAAIARRAHWQSWRWGEGSIRCVENIARDVGYCERSVQYAYRALVAGGWLAIDPRPGRTNHFTVLRPVVPLGLAVDNTPESVDDQPEPVENPVDNHRVGDPSTPATVAPGGAKVAPDQLPPTREIPPIAPHRRAENADGADAPAQPAPRWRREEPRAPSATDPPDPAGVTATPQRPEAAPDASSGAAPPSPLDPAGEHWSRAAARKLRPCPTCAAPAGEPCRGRRGQLRRANHADRRIPR